MAGKAKWTLSITAVLALAAQAPASLLVNEIMVNAPGGGDNGFEFVELKSDTPSMSLANISLIYVEGGPGGANMGDVDNIVNLGALSTGTNGLLLIRDAASNLIPAPAPATTVFVNDFNPDLENGGATIMLVQNFTGTLTTDLDPDNDGDLDGPFPWTSVLDVMTWHESSDTPPLPTYASELGGLQIPQQTFTPDALVRMSASFAYYMDVTGTNPGPYQTDATQIGPDNPGQFFLTPGSENTPEPSTLGLLLAGAALFVRRRVR